ncbi:MAG: nickel-dependent lactate racemase [Candidatus Methanofastidiosa archaeon]|nr:nickel-dependent lactate racemase [Candidatus Methanofastidiosa archaeon]
MSELTVKIPFGHSHLNVTLSKERLKLVKSKPYPPLTLSSIEIIEKSLQNPIGGKLLSELAQHCKEMVVVTSDQTRALPSSVTLPPLFAEARRFNPSLRIVLLVATGLHRPMTKKEMVEKFGTQVLNACSIIVHDANDQKQLVSLGSLSTGTPLIVNKIAYESELLITEGLVEPHFFAGFSGGRKSILPGICGYETIMSNHSPLNLNNQAATIGNLEENPIHKEALEAAQKLNVQFTLNTVIALDGVIRACFAGELDLSFRKAVEFVKHHTMVKVPRTPVTVISNLGYPLDRDLYQGVKGIFTGSLVTEEGGMVILVAECRDGIGHENFYRIFLNQNSPVSIYNKILSGVINGRDLWQVQILVKVLMRNRVAIVTGNKINKETASNMFLLHFNSIEEALTQADAWYGSHCKVNVIPEGPGVVPIPIF